AHASALEAGVVYSLAREPQADGETRRHGRPFSLAQLYQDSYIPLGAAIFRRALVDQGCRFDETLALFDDWDMFLQMAQLTAFRFVPHEGVQGNAAAARAEANEADSQRFRELVLAKWTGPRDALIDRVQPMLR